MSDSTFEPNLVSRNRVPHADGYRTPTIEDDDHPLNLWRSRQSQQMPSRDHSYLQLQNSNMKEQFDRLRKLGGHSANHDTEPDRKDDHDKQHLPWRRRLKHTTWAYFTMTMATGGIANVLHNSTLIHGSSNNMTPFPLLNM